jgi:FixJ family two-component response regulator
MLNIHHIQITPRDEQVLQLLIQGCSKKEIASQLKISPRTVKQHLRTCSCGPEFGMAENAQSWRPPCLQRRT